MGSVQILVAGVAGTPPLIVSEYSVLSITCVGSDQHHIGPMRSPLAAIGSWFSRVLYALQAAAVALEGILAHFKALVEALERFEVRESAQALPADDIRLEGLATRIDDLTLAVSEGVNNVQRSERRVRAVVTSARRQLAEAGYEHPGIEAEIGELRSLDGEGGNGEEVPAVPESVAGIDLDRPSVIPGLTVRQMQVARARRR